jgi:membrane fusion protein (multidrug efflux system)
MADTTIEETKTPAAVKRIVRKPKRRRAGLIALIILLPLLVGGYFLWRYFGTYESTDDAQIDGHIHAISARISGHVAQVLVQDQQIVKAGDALVVIDPRDYDVAVAKAEADVADAKAALTGCRQRFPSLRRIPPARCGPRTPHLRTAAPDCSPERQFQPPRRVWRPRRVG